MNIHLTQFNFSSSLQKVEAAHPENPKARLEFLRTLKAALAENNQPAAQAHSTFWCRDGIFFNRLSALIHSRWQTNADVVIHGAADGSSTRSVLLGLLRAEQNKNSTPISPTFSLQGGQLRLAPPKTSKPVGIQSLLAKLSPKLTSVELDPDQGFKQAFEKGSFTLTQSDVVNIGDAGCTEAFMMTYGGAPQVGKTFATPNYVRRHLGNFSIGDAFTHLERLKSGKRALLTQNMLYQLMMGGAKAQEQVKDYLRLAADRLQPGGFLALGKVDLTNGVADQVLENGDQLKLRPVKGTEMSVPKVDVQEVDGQRLAAFLPNQFVHKPFVFEKY